jgi:hypothetical protein
MQILSQEFKKTIFVCDIDHNRKWQGGHASHGVRAGHIITTRRKRRKIDTKDPRMVNAQAHHKMLTAAISA